MDWKTLRHPASAGDARKAVVLIVEDDVASREMWRMALLARDYEVKAAENAHDALALLEARPDVAVLDVHLGGPSGLWLADQIREISPLTAVVLATGDQTIPANESLRFGIVAYLVKPFTLEELGDAVQEGVRWSALRQGRG
jgi:DNA-binding NtrC family response regulator